MSQPLSVGFVSPLPPVRSGIADYSADLLPSLGELLRVTTYAPVDASRAVAAGHDAVLLQVGNDPLHAPSVEAIHANAGRVPLVLVLHDYSIHHLWAAAYLDTGRIAEYAAELERAHGEKGRELGEKALAGQRVPVWDLAPWRYPMSPAIVRDATAVIVHSRLVRGALLRECPSTFVAEVPHLVAPAPAFEKGEARRHLGLPTDRPIAATLGIVTPAKRVAKVLEGLALLPATQRPFLVVGGAVAGDDPLVAKVGDLGLRDDVVFTGYLEEPDFWRVASAADVCVNLRFPTVGETSGAVCRLAGSGLPVVVSDVGWFRELPDDFAWKVPIGDGEEETLARVLRQVVAEPQERARRAAAARAWGLARSPGRIAASYTRVVDAAVRGEAVPLTALSAVAREAEALGLGRPGRHGSRERGPDGAVLSALGERLEGIAPDPCVPFREEDLSPGASRSR